MKPYLLALSLAASLQAVAQTPGAPAAAAPVLGAATNAAPTIPPEIAAKFKTDEERNGYALGAMIADDMVNRVKKMGYDAPNEAIARGFSEWVTEKSTLTKDEVRKVFSVMQYDVSRKADEKRKMEGEKNVKDGQDYLAANRTKEGVVTLPSGMQYKVLKNGEGSTKPTAEETVVCHYRGTLLDGKEFDSSYSKGEPARFALNRVIKGWTEGVQLMSVGSKWQFVIPANLAYGPNGSPPRIPPNATLLFDIELVGIQGKTTNALAAPGTGAQPVVTSDIIKVPSKAELEKGAKIEVIKASDAERLQREKEAQQKKTDKQ